MTSSGRPTILAAWTEFILKRYINIQGVIQKFLGGSGSTKKCGHDCDQALIKSSWGSVYYTYISELRLWLHWGKFMDIRWVKAPSLAALQAANYMRTAK